ncbi:ABC-type antimicrobial peptide transport system, permease component [Azospirillum argentinense]
MTAPDDRDRGTEAGGGVLHILVVDAFQNLRAKRQRSLLALLGIAIGTAAIIAMVAIGENAKHHSLRQFQALGTDILAIQKDFAAPGLKAALTIQDADSLKSLPGVEVTVPLAVVGAEVAYGRNRASAAIAGVTGNVFQLARLKVERGRVLTELDRHQTFVVLGAEVARRLAAQGGALGVGVPVRMGGYNYTVIGVLEEALPNPLLPVDINNAALVPLPGVRRVTATAEITNILVRKTSDADNRAILHKISGYFSEGLRARPVMVQDARQLISAMEDEMRVHTLLLTAIGSISLLVGGVGVMNVMLMSVVERRREIGIRLALGARPCDIRTMFLIEALVLSFSGGLAGIALGVMAAALYAWNASWVFVPSLVAVPLGAGMSIGAGVFFGLYPAIQASRLQPIEALRSD